MSVTVDLPKGLEEQLNAVWGGNLPRAMKEALAAEGYRNGKLSLGQVAALLETSINNADGFLKGRGIMSPYSMQDLTEDIESIEKILRKQEKTS
jgi:predicted HTH domain antitoxin